MAETDNKVVEPVIEASAPVEKAPEAIPAAPKVVPEEVFDRRVGQLTAKNAAVEAEKQALERRLALAEEALNSVAPKGTKEGEEKTYTKAELDAEALKLASSLADKKVLADAAAARGDALYAAGKKTYGEAFDESLKSLSRVGAVTQPLIDALSELDNSADVLQALSEDLSEATRIAALPLAQMGVALAKHSMAIKDGKGPKISAAAAPLPVEVGGARRKTNPSVYDTEETSTAEWVKLRNKELKERRANR